MPYMPYMTRIVYDVHVADVHVHYRKQSGGEHEAAAQQLTITGANFGHSDSSPQARVVRCFVGNHTCVCVCT